MRTALRALFLVLVIAAASVASWGAWWLPNRPVALPAAPGGKIPSVSFAPFRDGQSPLTHIYPSRAEIDADLRAIAHHVAGIRTYTSLEGLEVVPELAAKHGLTVSMGAWLSAKEEINEKEIASLIALANQHPDTIKRVIVGNEVLLRRELPPDQLAAYIDRVRAAVKQPVAYADVWEFWLKHPEIAEHVDIVTIHLLPYWEDEPTSVQGAMARIKHAHDIIKARFPDKTIMVGETGWPSAGRTRSAAATGGVAQARFVGAVLDLAAKEGFDINVIEAFDQNWKQKMEGTVGGHWGLFDNDRLPKFTLGSKMEENPRWRFMAVAASLLAALTLSGLAALRGFDPMGRTVVTAIVAFTLANLVVIGGDQLTGWKAYPIDLAFGWTMVLATVLLMMAATATARNAFAIRALEMADNSPNQTLIVTTLALGLVAVVWAVLLIVDGRYRDFPNHHMITPVAALILVALVRWMTGVGPLRLEGAIASLARLLGALMLILALPTLVAEAFAPVESLIGGQLPIRQALMEVDWRHPNVQALVWTALLVLFGTRLRALGRRAVVEGAVVGGATHSEG